MVRCEIKKTESHKNHKKCGLICGQKYWLVCKLKHAGGGQA